MNVIGKEILKDIYQPRPAEVRKYDFGLMLVIGGSDFYSGAPALSGLAGFRAGVDMVRIIAPERAANIIASFSPVLAALPLRNHYLLQEHLATLLSRTEAGKDTARGNIGVVIGGGLGRTKETLETIVQYLSQVQAPVIIDADGLHAVATNPKVLQGRPFVITPNTYEFMLLTGKEVWGLSLEEKAATVQQEAARLETTIMLKGAHDIISNGKEVLVNKTGSSFMSGGGTGDTLAGIAGAILARGVSPMHAAAAATFINGRAGEIAGKKFQESMLATDLIDAIPEAIR